MGTGWIEAVMRTNGAIVDAEARFNAQVTDLIATAKRGQDTTEAETLLHEHKRMLMLLRSFQVQLLQEGQDEA